MPTTPIGSSPVAPLAGVNQPAVAEGTSQQSTNTGNPVTDGMEYGSSQSMPQMANPFGVDGDGPDVIGRFSADGQSGLHSLGSNLVGMSAADAQAQFATLLQNGPTIDYQDVNALVQQVLREAYGQNTEDLRHYAGKVKHFNKQKEMVRNFLSELRELSTASREQAIQSGKTGDDLDTAGLSGTGSFYSAGSADAETAMMMGMPQSLSDLPAGKEVDSLAKLDDYIKTWEDKLNSIGDDAQLANVDLQNMLQKQQQTLQMLSNISKALHDTAMAIIRKMGG